MKYPYEVKEFAKVRMDIQLVIRKKPNITNQ